MSTPQPPTQLQTNTVEARLIRSKIWNRLHINNEHFMAAIVGREGSGKSHTGIKLSETVDPTFDASRIMFDPETFLRRLRKWKAEKETRGKAVVADEAGVGVGVRTWYEKDQILFNQVLQVIRNENMSMIFTVPRLNELDSQTRGRLHAYIEMTDKDTGEWAEFKWLNWDPTRDERDKIYREKPQMRINGSRRPVQRLRVSPPTPSLVEEYERRKAEFQDELYQKAIDELEEDADDEKSVKEVAVEIINNGLERYVSRHSQNNLPYINDQLIRADYELSLNDAKAVKSLVEQRFTKEGLEEFA